MGAGDVIGAVESVKSASDILTPVRGTVVEVNEALEAKPSIINLDPEGGGWIARIEVGKREGDGDGKGGGEEELMDEEGYRRFTEEL